MFLDRYLNSAYLDLVHSNYDERYINLLDENNFNKVYMLLKSNKFNFIEDIILNYLELFEIDAKYIESALSDIKVILGDNYVEKISKNMTILDKVIELSNAYNENEFME